MMPSRADNVWGTQSFPEPSLEFERYKYLTENSCSYDYSDALFQASNLADGRIKRLGILQYSVGGDTSLGNSKVVQVIRAPGRHILHNGCNARVAA